ncbi:MULTISPECIES: peptidase domain-containing ABC transporter [unclassified Lysinibacillus]|uniref:peptidase domain-containing ABC transporter n=1 Tax=unclassified Lysinibacillus TaxID=2636778 RepID=UPI0020123C66|nr:MULTISPECIES: peptidase domain-containing ABC transporter [unclassified Lysinibacillus]MCL1695626.1 peptidase domain-containing ABC transporter [Lysinibacillus sp. BPa_S21]MCL1700129.1 peptidase domain-containing ABC transporter [Lysinibacillus sp. Bpr_S20]
MKKVPYIEQMSQTECGIACLAMIAAYYKCNIPLYELREKLGNGRDGNTLYDLYQVAKEYKFETKCLKASVNNISQVDLPVIIFWEHKHYVVLEKIKNNHFYIIDPSFGRKKVDQIEFEEKFSEYILLLCPGESFQKRKEESLWKPYLKLLTLRPSIMFGLLGISLILQLFVLITPILTQKLVDNLAGKNGDISIILVGIILSFISYFIFNLLKSEVSLRLFKFLDFTMSWDFFKHLLDLPYSFYQVRQSGDLLYRFSNLRAIRSILSNQIMKNILDLFLLIFIVGYMFYKSFILSLWIIGLSIIIYLVVLGLRPLIHELNRSELLKDTNLYSFQTESILGILNIKTSGSEKQIQDRWKKFYLEFANAFVKKERVFNFMTSFTGSLTYFAPLLILWIGSHSVLNGTLSMGELIAFQTISTFFISTSNSFIMSIDSFFQLKVYLRRIRDVMDTPTESSDDGKEKIDLLGNIYLENVDFSYTEQGDSIIQNISLQIEAGQKVAIVGPSGSGKSTLAKIIVGLHKPIKGEIFFENMPLSKLNKSYLRRQMGIVTQDPFLFNQSIADNIKLNRDEINNYHVANAASIAQIHDEIMKMPMNYETIISEMGQNISGGQRQRIALARSLVNQPRVLVLDEATNALDSLNEKRIDEYLSEIKCTRIIIAHRLSSIVDADQIVVMEDGKIIGIGKHEELIIENEFYKKLYDTNSQLDLKGGEKYEEIDGDRVEEPLYSKQQY